MAQNNNNPVKIITGYKDDLIDLENERDKKFKEIYKEVNEELKTFVDEALYSEGFPLDVKDKVKERIKELIAYFIEIEKEEKASTTITCKNGTK